MKKENKRFLTKKSSISTIALVFFSAIFFVACDQNEQVKPLGQVRLEYPASKYKNYQSNCPFSFNYSNAANILVNKQDACKLTVHYPKMKANIYLTYFPINSKPDLITKIKDSEKFVQEQTVKASYISPREFRFEDHKVFGTLYELGGESAINYKFHVTDSVKNFVSGSVYFSTKPNPDSLAPAIQFMQKDVMQLIESVRWKN